MALQRRTFVIRTSALASGLTVAAAAHGWGRSTTSAAAVPGAAHGALLGFGYPTTANFGYPGVSIAVAWNRALLAAIAATRTQATVAARACSMTHEAIYNAWAVWDRNAKFTLSAMRQRPSAEKTSAMLAIAISNAAAIVLRELFPTQVATFNSLLAFAAPMPSGGGIEAYKANAAKEAGVLAGNSLLKARRSDGSNQLGDLASGAYTDYTGYAAVNTPDSIVNIDRWQPLRLVDANGVTVVQSYLTPQWGKVKPFALSSGSVYRPLMAHYAPSQAEMDQLIAYSAALDDRSKSLVELWAANPGTVSPPGQWMQIAEQVSANDANTLDLDVKLFFTLAQAVLDASIAAWDTKRFYDSVRPITAIPYYYRNQTIDSWGGPNQGTRAILGQNWRPYQRATAPTPPFPEFPSGHSTFSAASAAVIAGLRSGGDSIATSGSVGVGGITFETNVPSTVVTYTYATLTEAAISAGLSRRVGGIHFEQGDLQGRALGQKVGAAVLAKCKSLFAG